jgi:hypothetical protein
VGEEGFSAYFHRVMANFPLAMHLVTLTLIDFHREKETSSTSTLEPSLWGSFEHLTIRQGCLLFTFEMRKA